MKKFAVMAVNIGEGSDFVPQLITIEESKWSARNEALHYLNRECDEIRDQSGCQMIIDTERLRASDTHGMYAIQMNVQEIELDVRFSS